MGSEPKTRVVNIHHGVPYDVYIGRGSIFGNRWSHLPSSKNVIRVSTREEAFFNYKEWVPTQKHILMQLRYLKGKTLGCFCAPHLCHGYILAEMADNYEYWEEVAKTL